MESVHIPNAIWQKYLFAANLMSAGAKAGTNQAVMLYSRI